MNSWLSLDWKEIRTKVAIIALSFLGGAIISLGTAAIFLREERAQVLQSTSWVVEQKSRVDFVLAEWEEFREKMLAIQSQIGSIDDRTARIENLFLLPVGRARVLPSGGSNSWITLNVSGPAAQLYVIGSTTALGRQFYVRVVNVSNPTRPSVERVRVAGTYDDPESKTLGRLSHNLGQELEAGTSSSVTVSISLQLSVH